MAGLSVCSILSVFLLAVSEPPLPSTMKSIRHDIASGSLHVELGTPLPELKEGDVLIKVEAAGVNRLDLMQARGKYPPPPGESDILGVEVAGTVEKVTALAEAKTGLQRGDRVMALVGGGGYASYCRCQYQTVMRVPEGISMEQAAGIPEVFTTAYQALVTNGRMRDNETVLIHAGASGVGLAAIQLSKTLFKNVRVIVTAGSAEKLAVCKQFGADVLINYKAQDFAEEVLGATDNKGADVILDPIGASYLDKHVRCAAVDSRLLSIGFLGGSVVDSFNMLPLLRKRVSLIFSTLRARSLDYKEMLTQELITRVLPLFTASSLRVAIDSSLPLHEAAAAHKRMADNKNTGKIVLTL